MNRAELDAQIKAARDLAESLERMRDAMLVETEAVKEWPQNGDVIFGVYADGTIYRSTFSIKEASDMGAKAIGNCFRTKAQALRRVEALKVAAELRRMPGRCAFSPDKILYCLQFHSDDSLRVRGGSRWACGHVAIAGVWFNSFDVAEHAIHTIGPDRLAVYLQDFLDEPMGDE